eukprot:1637072-Pyramimonas_sp.AAC.1
MHTNDMLEPLGRLRMSGWIAEGAGCILAGEAEDIGGWVRGSKGLVRGTALLSVCSECDIPRKQKVCKR